MYHTHNTTTQHTTTTLSLTPSHLMFLGEEEEERRTKTQKPISEFYVSEVHLQCSYNSRIITRMAIHVIDPEDIGFGTGAIGGVLVGISVLILFYFIGYTTGCSGFTKGAFFISEAKDCDSWKITYLLGLFISGMFMVAAMPDQFGDDQSIDLSYTALILGGILVGFGTAMSNGCTSGHGLCGMGRRSPRSTAACGVFMLTGALSAYIARRDYLLESVFYDSLVISLLVILWDNLGFDEERPI